MHTKIMLCKDCFAGDKEKVHMDIDECPECKVPLMKIGDIWQMDEPVADPTEETGSNS